MDYNLFIIPFLKSFLVAAGLSLALILLSEKIKTRKRKSSRHIHSKKVSRLGGAAIISAFLISILTDQNLVITTQLYGIIAASLFILAVGLWDDFWKLEWKTQLFFQICAAISVFIMGVQVEYITNPLGGVVFLNLGKYLIPSLLFVIAWLVIMMNAMNWLDGIDGLSGGMAFIGALTIFFLSLSPEVNQPPVGIIAVILAGAALGFLIFNFYPARIMAGTSGAMFMGFALAALAIFAGTKIATALLIMAIPVIDVFWVIGERIKAGNPIFKSDTRHLHRKLMELGWTQRKIALFFYAVTFSIAVVALNTRTIGKLITIVLVAVIMVTALIIINKKLSSNVKSKARAS
ncbi:undecaprenyl/decaprenyl-phosphate alpha-N-acetylglucosaminyl 1-phosphate transferase [bacterium]|nr:undecaprenyl/decaprenyl-phosphate alpha-N-acetylglucosaminyl 1-phosphate transferase [bacterium]